MRVHTANFKSAIKELGRELKGIITYENDQQESVELEEEIMSITPHFEADILKSVMKQLDLELSVNIPLETIINCQVGIYVNSDYEMINFGNYVVYSSEKQEDTGNYKIICYDKMLYAMKQNEDLGISYPITIKNYLMALANKIGLGVATTNFYNDSLTIQDELYVGEEYTYRDILDEIAEATGSIICLNINDGIELRYPTATNDTIDEEFLKDVNVDFGKKYGPINSIVLSRSAESDNVYLQDTTSVMENGLCEVKIVDNQIMNFNNRSDFLQGILTALDGLEYYINDFNSTGILYYEVGDIYNVQIGENIYQCLMLNDEINVTTGIQEIIHTDMPVKSETDYSKADKTDRRINQTYLIVDKQNQVIDGMVTNVSEQNTKIANLRIDVDDLMSQIQDIADITTSAESQIAKVNLSDINISEPIMIKVRPIGESIIRQYPKRNLFPSSNEYLKTRIINFKRTYEEDGETKTEDIPYELPDDLLYYNGDYYDEFYLNYDSETCQITKRCEWFGGVNNIFNPAFSKTTSNISSLNITGFEHWNVKSSNSSNNIITINKNFLLTQELSYSFAFSNLENITSSDAKVIATYYNSSNVNIGTSIYEESGTIRYDDLSQNARYCTITLRFDNMTANKEYGFNFMMNTGTTALPFETYNPVIKPTGTEQVIDYTPYPRILLGTGDYEVSLLGYNIGYLAVRLMATNVYTELFATRAEMTSTIDQTARSITMAVEENYYSKDETMSRAEINVTAAEINNEVRTKVGEDEIISKINQTPEQITIDANKINLAGKAINLTSDNMSISSNNFNVDKYGNMTCTNANIQGGNINMQGSASTPTIKIYDYSNNEIEMYPSNFYMVYDYFGDTIGQYLQKGGYYVENESTGQSTTVWYDGITTPRVTQTSKVEDKKNFEKLKNALDIIKKIDIYKYNLKDEKDGDKKHIGFVIGDKFNYSKETTSKNNDGVDIYSFISVCCKAIKEQQEQIEQMKKEIEELRGGNK